ncbi:hypothetical protein NDU88_008218 [Pleurodeles waltl]|uniref:Uncharacterized protein n=1 Tax=Pleurodeles waltl TaxID=8319 RepID=A0AAV7PNW1_PLEWA|nr:hypothetical protein NDU88_008218 [Pleurodeles waltl]
MDGNEEVGAKTKDDEIEDQSQSSDRRAQLDPAEEQDALDAQEGARSIASVKGLNPENLEEWKEKRTSKLDLTKLKLEKGKAEAE